MFKKISFLLVVLCLPACFEPNKKKISPTITPASPVSSTQPLACKNQLCIWPIQKMNMVQTFIDQHIQQGYAPSEILVIFDIDETLLNSFAEKNGIIKQLAAHDTFPHIANNIIIKNTPAEIVQQIGAENIHINKNKELATYIDPALIEAAKSKTYDIFASLHKKKLFSSKPSEPEVGSFIRQLQDIGIKTMGLTARGMDMKESTLDQFKRAGINLASNTVYNKEHQLINKYHGFSNGVLFSNPGKEGFDKGNLLIQFLHEIKYQPTIIIFVDDNMYFIESVQKALFKSYPDITFDGLWYQFKRLNEFDKGLLDHLVKRLLGDSWWKLDGYYQAPVHTGTKNVTMINTR